MTTIYATPANERKAQQLAFDAYNHLKDYLSENYDTLTDKELDNMIHNVEQMIPTVENPSVELLRPTLVKVAFCLYNIFNKSGKQCGKVETRSRIKAFA